MLQGIEESKSHLSAFHEGQSEQFFQFFKTSAALESASRRIFQGVSARETSVSKLPGSQLSSFSEGEQPIAGRDTQEKHIEPDSINVFLLPNSCILDTT